MEAQWINIAILYAWFLSGLYAFKIQMKTPLNLPAGFAGFAVFISFFLGPVSLLFILIHKNLNVLTALFAKKHVEDMRFKNLVFLNEHGQDMFADRQVNSQTVERSKKLIYNAIVKNASDIFIDPKDDSSVVRFRVNGMIRIYDTLLNEQGSSVISMIKVAAGMDIAEKRRPQDGSFTVSCNDLNVSFRVASVGVFGGEKITIRVIAEENGNRNLDNLGMIPEQLRTVKTGLKLPSGMVLICGPTGSGKTSTLYSMLDGIDYSMKNVISIEDPVERVMPRISQMEVNVKADITFASLLRNSLRQNPDIICIGEIRDEETAEIAAHAAQTGHLIIATLHSNNNIGTIVRLTDLGIPLRSLAACLHLVISQQLVRTICPHCRKTAILTPYQQELCKQYQIPPQYVQIAPGCPRCDHTGYSGRRALFEILQMNTGLRSLMEDPAVKITDIEEYIQKNQGNQTILSISREMVVKGEMTLDEFERINTNF